MKTLRLSILLAVLMSIVCTKACAYDAKIDGIYYTFNASAKTAEVTYMDKGLEENCNAYSGSITIPRSVTYKKKKYRVTSIDYFAFSACRGLTSITIPSSVTSIGGFAFWGCSGLTSVTIPGSVTFIDIDAFGGCSGLTSITVKSGNTVYDSRNNCNAIIETASNTLVAGCKNTIIPNTVTSIGSSAFIGRIGLTSVSIPSSVTFIDNSAFVGCSGLTSITVKSDNTVYDSRNNCNAIIETASNTLVAGCKNTIIPNTVTSIGSSAFDGCSGLTSINIPNNVASIGKYAFDGCSGLTSITIPNNVTGIGKYAFYHCRGLASVTIPNSVTSIDEGAFCGCRSLTSITIPNSVTAIGDYAFNGCSGLTSITIPNNVTGIGKYAFYRCSSLTNVKGLHEGIEIADDAFDATPFGETGYRNSYDYLANNYIIQKSRSGRRNANLKSLRNTESE